MSKQNYFENAMHKVTQNDFESAIDLFSKALQIENDKSKVYYNRGVAYLNLEKIDLAIFDFNKLIELDPNNAFNYSCRAFAKARSTNKKGALEDYEKALELDPDNPITYNNMGLVQEEIGYMEQAQKSFEQSDDLRKKEEANKIINATEDQIIKQTVDTRIENLEHKLNIENSSLANENEPTSKGKIVKDIFTDKNTFKEFMNFIKNGFKLK